IGNKKVRMRWFNIFGILLTIAAMLIMGWSSGKSIVMDVIFISAGLLGIGVSLPCLDALIVEGVDKDVRGIVTSFYSSMRFIGVAAGPPISSIMMTPTAAPF